MNSPEKVKIKIALTTVLILALFVFGSFTVGAAGKKSYWLVTDGNIDPSSDLVEYVTIWSGTGLETRTAEFQWYVDSGSYGGVPLSNTGGKLGGVKALVTLIGIENDLQLTIKIYKGGESKPSIGPEVYIWTIVNGKDSPNDRISLVFTDKASGKISKVITLYENDEQGIGIPNGSDFECRIWLM